MIENRKDFISTYWKYYCILEDDFVNLIKYVDLRENNYDTTSNVIIKQLQSTCSEFENISKEIIESDKKNKNIGIVDIYKGLNEGIDEILEELKVIKIQDVHINVRQTKDLIIYPFKDWNEKEPGKLFWWDNYNKIKHSRVENYQSGNFKSLLYSLGALYFLERVLVRKVYYRTREMDIPDKQSELFYIEHFGLKWSLDDEIKNKEG